MSALKVSLYLVIVQIIFSDHLELMSTFWVVSNVYNVLLMDLLEGESRVEIIITVHEQTCYIIFLSCVISLLPKDPLFRTYPFILLSSKFHHYQFKRRV